MDTPKSTWIVWYENGNGQGGYGNGEDLNRAECEARYFWRFAFGWGRTPAKHRIQRLEDEGRKVVEYVGTGYVEKIPE